jgi:E3 ubiquitin-protein ligase MYCBP2
LRLEYEALGNAAELEEGGRFHGDPAGFAMSRFSYYLCYKCSRPYFGGGVQCEAAADFDPSELVCGSCSNPGEVVTCNKHGDDYLEYKCRYCCSVAVWFCFGTTHFCNTCHSRPEVGPDMARANELPPCPAGPLGAQLEGPCPLRVEHPETGKEFALGCGICRNALTF